MKNFTLIAALSLCSFSWISASVSPSQTVEVQPGNEVTLQCNMNTNGVVIFWFRLVNRTKVSCVSVKIHPADAQNCEGFGNGRFEMTSNDSTVSLKISSVAKSDAGLYICGLYTSGNLTFNVVRLDVKGSDEPHDDEDSKEHCDGVGKLTSAILGGLTFFLVNVIVGLVVKVRKLQTAATEENNPQQCENLLSDQLKDEALSCYPTPVRSRRPASEREVETRVIYTASSQTQRG
ncbi:uncharacterized protein LOC115588958 [Sparus aurata]|uniref:uncharacterized protein LOC115588958 n=1 Tax=Sparus aurata TaxID=8175 RepID=UPI0011C10A7C|nr:uncharacterized protein LOC115588958 [Sparus aurata]